MGAACLAWKMRMSAVNTAVWICAIFVRAVNSGKVFVSAGNIIP